MIRATAMGWLWIAIILFALVPWAAASIREPLAGSLIIIGIGAGVTALSKI